MAEYRINGKRRLSGEVWVQGAKNSALPILAASLLTDGQSVIRNCPRLSDTEAALQILRECGCKAIWQQDAVILNTDTFSKSEISPDLCGRMRSSVVFLGPLLARTHRAELSLPGGCRLGARPIDLHLQGLAQMGAVIRFEEDRLICHAPQGLHGSRITLRFPSVGATENLMMAATLAQGTTVLQGCAREPEIADLAAYLNRCGAKILGAGESFIQIVGVPRLFGCEYTVMGDRIAAMTYLIAGAMTNGDVTVRGIHPRLMAAPLRKLLQTGKNLCCNENSCRLSGNRPLMAIPFVGTGPYPDFPTDCLPLFFSMGAAAEGSGVFVENIFENRFSTADDLIRMGGCIYRQGRVAAVRGTRLHGEPVCARDLRGGAGLVLAALAAEGTTIVDGVHWIRRGYERLWEDLSRLGAEICKK